MRHGHFAVNGRKTDIPSYRMKVGDTVGVRKPHHERELYKTVKETLRSHQAPSWLTLDVATSTGGDRGAAPRPDADRFDEPVVVEYYSR